MHLRSLIAPLSLSLLACSGGPAPVAVPAPTPAAPAAPLPATPAKTYDPSFDCAKATTPTEKRICASAELSGLDRDLSSAWKAATAAHPEQKDDLKTQQRQWLKSNASCVDDLCLSVRYRERIGFLKGIASVPGSGSGVSGTWSDGDNDIAILQTGDKIEYNLQAFRILTEDNVHMGFAHGIAPLKGSTAISRPDDTENCTLTFTFTGDSLELEQGGGDFECGFGAGVYAGGTYKRTNRTPDMNSPM